MFVCKSCLRRLGDGTVVRSFSLPCTEAFWGWGDQRVTVRFSVYCGFWGRSGSHVPVNVQRLGFPLRGSSWNPGDQRVAVASSLYRGFCSRDDQRVDVGLFGG